MTRIVRTHLMVVVLALAAVISFAQGLPTARPEDEGLSPERLAYIDKFYSEKIDRGATAVVIASSALGSVNFRH